MAVGAVVVAYNSARQLPVCLRALQTGGVREVVVVDNASVDGSASVAAQAGARTLSLEQNRGFAAASNAGARQLATPYLLFINPDAEVMGEAVRDAEAYVAAHPAVGVVGLSLRDDQGKVEPGSFGDEVTIWSLARRRGAAGAHTVPREPTHCAWVSAGAMLARREAWEAVNGLDPGFFLYWEDVDFCRRVRQAGWRVVLLPTALVQHQRGVSLTDRRQKTKLYDASADRYFRKHYATTIWLMQRGLRVLYRLFSPEVH